MPLPTKLEIRQAVIHAHQEGDSNKKIAEEFGIHRHTVANILKKHGKKGTTAAAKKERILLPLPLSRKLNQFSSFFGIDPIEQLETDLDTMIAWYQSDPSLDLPGDFRELQDIVILFKTWGLTLAEGIEKVREAKDFLETLNHRTETKEVELERLEDTLKQHKKNVKDLETLQTKLEPRVKFLETKYVEGMEKLGELEDRKKALQEEITPFEAKHAIIEGLLATQKEKGINILKDTQLSKKDAAVRQAELKAEIEQLEELRDKTEHAITTEVGEMMANALTVIDSFRKEMIWRTSQGATPNEGIPLQQALPAAIRTRLQDGSPMLGTLDLTQLQEAFDAYQQAQRSKQEQAAESD